MRGIADETVGEKFDRDLLEKARDLTLEVILEAAALVKPGMKELEAKRLVQKIQTEKGSPKAWHPPQIRFGENTLLPFGGKGLENPELKANDIFFFDIGPLFHEHEGDVGRPFAVGNDEEMKRCCVDAEKIWNEVRVHWQTSGASGRELYSFATERATQYGWKLLLDKANGHRIADFPHAARRRGSVEGFPEKPAANRWILEIQIRHPKRAFGAFYEDLLN
jgi:Xaa-Pro aminopeptidase